LRGAGRSPELVAVDLAERVRAATVGRVEAARDEGWITPEHA
jgi:hypothetical protein